MSVFGGGLGCFNGPELKILQVINSPKYIGITNVELPVYSPSA